MTAKIQAPFVQMVPYIVHVALSLKQGQGDEPSRLLQPWREDLFC